MHGNIPYLFDQWGRSGCSSPSTKDLHGRAVGAACGDGEGRDGYIGGTGTLVT